jgi:GT2 family glycosyltransferase
MSVACTLLFMGELPSISVVVLSFNRKDALRHTLTQVFSQQWARTSQVIVVDNASSDASAEMVQAEFSQVKLIALRTNVLIEGFNIGAREATSELLLILDDDSWPQVGAVEAACEYMRKHPSTVGVMLHRKHPKTQHYEWPFEALTLAGVQTQWPDMGCGNFYRTRAWQAVGGYEQKYELYRNDTDIALKLLASGGDVVFCKDWLVWHDSKIASRKSDKWLWLSTRNWVWMAKRHAKGTLLVRGVLLGWLHAHRLAGLRPSGHWATLRGALRGVCTRAPELPKSLQDAASRARAAGAYRKLLELKMKLRA